MPLIAPMLVRLRDAIRQGRVVVSAKAIDEAQDDLGWERAAILSCLSSLRLVDFERTEPSAVRPADLIWVFCPEVCERTLWIRLVERDGFIIISFHLAGEP